MRIADVVLLAKKIVVGIVVTFVPLAILFGALSFTASGAKKKAASTTDHPAEISHAN